MIRDYLGVGVRFPVAVDTYGRQALVDDVTLVKQSLARIFNTPVGTDFVNRRFGSRVHELRFEPNSRILQSLLEYFIEDAIEAWENRVRYLGTDFEIVGADQLNCTVRYSLRAGGQPDSFVFPFYRDKAA